MSAVAYQPAGRHPAPPGPTDRVPAQRRLVGLALVTGLALEIGLRGGVDNAVVVAGVVVVVLLLVADGYVAQRQARLATLGAIAPVAFLAVRASTWLAWSNLAVAAALLLAGLLYSRSGSPLDATPRRVLQRALPATAGAMAGLVVVRALAPRLSDREIHRIGGLARALAVSLPVLAALVALLASADAVFASLLTVDVDLGPAVGHALAAVACAVVVLGLAAAAAAPVTDRHRRGGFGVTEAATMLALVAVVLGLFVVSQLVALTGAGQRLVESAGLTPAEYARSGFFQLCWAAGLLLAFLALVRALASAEALERRAVRWLGAAVPALALGLVVVSLRRMALYDRAFGLTMLRLWVIGAAVWMGLVFLMTLARNLGVGTDRDWLVAGACIAAVALVLVADVADPEAFVARHNLARARQGADLDIAYLAELTDDAVPTIADAMAVADGRDRQQLGYALRCHDRRGGVAALNLAAARAEEARRDLCPPTTVSLLKSAASGEGEPRRTR